MFNQLTIPSPMTELQCISWHEYINQLYVCSCSTSNSCISQVGQSVWYVDKQLIHFGENYLEYVL